MTQGRHIVLVGPMGAGKTLVGALLAARLGLPFVDADAALEADAGMAIAALFEREGEPAFRQRESAMLRHLLDGPRSVIATGGGVVLRAENREVLRAHAHVVHLQVDVHTQLQRLAGCTQRPLLQGKDRRARLQALAQARDGLYAQVRDRVVDTHSRTPQAVCDAICAALEPAA